MKTKVYHNIKRQKETRYLVSLTNNKELKEAEINVDENYKQIVIEFDNEYIDVLELINKLEEITEDGNIFILTHNKDNEESIDNLKDLQHIHIYLKTNAHNNTIYSIVNNIKKIDKKEFIEELNDLNKIELSFTNNNQNLKEKGSKMKKTLLNYNSITKFENNIPEFTGAVIVKENGEEVAIGDRKSGFSKNDLQKLKENKNERIPLYIQYHLTFADNITTEERHQLVENLKKTFKNVKIENNNPKNLIFTIQNYKIENDILKVNKITSTHLKILKFLNNNNLNVINMNARKDYIFKHIKYKDEDIQNINKYIVKPVARLYEEYVKEEQTQEETQQIKDEVKQENKEQTHPVEQEINIEEITDEEIKKEIENIDKEIENVNNNKYISDELKQQILKELETKKIDYYNKYLEKLEEQKKLTIEELENKVKELNNNLNNLQTEHEKIKKEKEKLQTELNNIQKELDELKEELKLDKKLSTEELKNKIIELVNNYNTKVNELNGIINDWNTKYNELKKEKEDLEKENTELKEKNKNLEEEKETLKKQNTKLQEDLEKSNKITKENKKTIEEQEKQITKLLKTQQQIKDTKQTIKEILDNNKFDNNRKIEELNKLKEKLDPGLKEYIEDIIDNNIKHLEQIEQLKNENKQLKEEHTKEIKQLKEDFEKEIEEKLNKQKEDLEEEFNKKLNDELKKLTDEHNKQYKQRLKNELNKKENEVKKDYEKEINKLNNRLNELEELNKKIIEIAEKILEHTNLTEEEKEEIKSQFNLQ